MQCKKAKNWGKRPPLAPRIPALEPGIGRDLSEIFKMRSKHILGLLCAAAISVALSGAASAQTKTVKIGGSIR
jgi:branched-chain amino acid transport system substrate-binding protein